MGNKSSLNYLQSLSKQELIKYILKENNVIRSPEDATKILAISECVKDWNKENFVVLGLNSKNVVIFAELVCFGSLASVSVHPREVLIPVLLNHCAGFIIAHNHPSGNIEPSESDNNITEVLKQAGEAVGVKLLDHIIFTQFAEIYYSYNDNNLINGV